MFISSTKIMNEYERITNIKMEIKVRIIVFGGDIMNDELFQGYEIKEENGEYKIILQLKPFNEEFTSELGVIIKNKKNNLKESASSFVKTHLPKIKKASVIIMAGTVLLTIFPLEKAHAHEANFNMTYLYFGNS